MKIKEITASWAQVKVSFGPSFRQQLAKRRQRPFDIRDLKLTPKITPKYKPNEAKSRPRAVPETPP